MKTKMLKGAGVLLPIASLPGDFGIGDFGHHAYEFVDMLAENGFKYWQILPLNPLGFGNSPYQPYSSFALDEIYIDISKIGYSGEKVKCGRIDYVKARETKKKAIEDSFDSLSDKEKKDIASFAKSNAFVEPYARFMAIRSKTSLPWNKWGRKEESLLEESDILLEEYKCFLSSKQWNELHEYAKKKGIFIIGDLPFYVGYDSADVYGNQKSFALTPKSKECIDVAGVPPDYFSETGQRWGNPIYDWKYLSKNGFRFLFERIAFNSSIYDFLRLDHFRAFDTYYRIPSSCENAIGGRWEEAPGYEFFDALFKSHPDLEGRIIAEDLGELRQEVYALRDHYGFPGMDVAQFTFEDVEFHNCEAFNRQNQIAYLGTHDNDVALSFFYQMDDVREAKWIDAMNKLGIDKGRVNERLMRYVLNKKCKVAILLAQDICGFDGETRINTPGTLSSSNWSWKLSDFETLKAKMAEAGALVRESGR